MPEVVSINYVILAMVTGAILLASVYHSVLFVHNRLKLIGYYSVYLWSASAYCLMRCIFYSSVPDGYFFSADEVVQMITFALYIRFAAVAMELHRFEDKMAYWFCKITPWIMAAYFAAHVITHYLFYTGHGSRLGYIIAYLSIRAFLLFVGFTSLVAVIKKRQRTYFRYIFYAILTIIFTGFLATIIEVWWKQSAYITPLTILVIGYSTDVCFFSAAISYKMRLETLEKESANRRVLEQEIEIQKNAMEQLVLSFKVKEEERSRIATELHDEIGSTLSSISILSDVITKERNETSIRAMQQEIKSNSKVMMEKMDDIIFSLNPRNDSMEKMLLRIRQFATPLFEATNIDYQFDFDRDIYDLPFPMEKRQQVYLIMKEAINNVIKHAHCTTASVIAKSTGDDLIFGITDNGKGFDTHTEFPGNGLLNMKHRADKMGADIRFRSTPYLETSVSLRIKIG